MLASTFLDMVVGVDIHWEMLPAPPAPPPAGIPTPLPNPFVGMTFDPIGAAVGIALGGAVSAVMGAPFKGPVLVWTVWPAVNTGTEAKNYLGVPHILIPPGFAWAPVPKTPKPVIRLGETPDPPKPLMPDGDAVVITGSKTVQVMGSNWARLGDIALSCGEPVRLPSSTILPIPKGAPVLVGGPMSLDLMAAVLASLRTRFISDSLHSVISRLSPGRLRNALHRIACFLTGHPVDVASGRVLTDAIDATLPGPLPLTLERVYSSGFASRSGPMGYGWNHSLNQSVWEEPGKVVYLAEDGREIEFDVFDLPSHRMRGGDSVYDPMNRLTLRCEGGNRWRITTAAGLEHSFDAFTTAEGATARLTTIRSRDGHHTIELTYDRRARLEWCRDSTGRLIGFEHDAQGRLVKLKLPLPEGRGWYVHRQYGYDHAGDLVSVTDSNGASYRHEYVNHLLVRETDRTGLSFHFEYDGASEDAYCTRTWGDGGIFDHVIRYDKNGRKTFVVDSLGFTTTYVQNPFGLVTEVIDPLGGTKKYRYDPRTLQPVEETDATGYSVVTSYDARGNAVEHRGSDGSRVFFEIDDSGDLRAAIDAGGGRWTFERDEAGHLTARTSPNGETVHLTWARGLLVALADATGRRTEIEYDERKLPVLVRDAKGGQTELRLDGLGNVTKMRDARGRTVRHRYDAEGRLLESESLAGLLQHCAYDAEGYLVEMRDATRHLLLEYAGYHQVARRTSGAVSESFEHDTEGRLTRVIDGAGAAYELRYDEAGRVRSERAFDGRVTTYRRDAAGRVLQVRSGSGRTTKLRYDAAGRLEQAAHSDGGFLELQYREDGAVVEARSTTGAVSLARDALGRITSEACGDWKISRRFASDGQRTEVASSLGARQSIVHDPLGEILGITMGAPLRRAGDDRVVFERDALGDELARSALGVVRSEWHRDPLGRPVDQILTRSGAHDGAGLVHRRYEWRGYDQIAAIFDSENGPRRFEHDDAGRLVREGRPDGIVERRFDRAGNVVGSPNGEERLYGPGGRVLARGATRYEHDEDGQRTRRVDADGSEWCYAWNGDGTLASVTRPDASVVRFTYDAFARRTAKSLLAPDGEHVLRETRYVWDGNVVLHELDSDRGLTTWYWEPGTFAPLAKESNGRRWLVVTDHLGTPTELVDDHAEITWQMQLDVEGQVTMGRGARADCPWRWPGQYEDEETGLWYNRYRYFDPGTGAYLSPDPIGLNGGTRLYGYVLDPLMASDPLGLAQCVHKPSNNPLVDDFVRELDDAVQAAAKAVDAGSLANPSARLFQKIRGVPGLGWLATMVRGTAIQQIAEATVKNGPAHQAINAAGGVVRFNQGSILGHLSPRGRPLRPDVQIQMPSTAPHAPNPVHILDVTTPAQAAAGKILKYNHPNVVGLIDITY